MCLYVHKCEYSWDWWAISHWASSKLELTSSRRNVWINHHHSGFQSLSLAPMNTLRNVNTQTLQNSRIDNFVGIFWNFRKKSTFCCIRKVVLFSSGGYRIALFKKSTGWDLATWSGLQRGFPCPHPRYRNWKQTLSQLFIFGVRFFQKTSHNSLCCFARGDLLHVCSSMGMAAINYC